MPSLYKLHPLPAPPTTTPTASEPFTRALVQLTRTIWHPACTFETAIGAICETAATALQLERVSVWQYEQSAIQLRCLAAYDAEAGAHEPIDGLETLSLDGDDYMLALKEARTFEASEVEFDAEASGSHRALRDYLQRHHIHALLDAPAYVEGELQGVICHESIRRLRQWSREEITFAASMGDYVAMAYEIARRRRAEAEVEHLRLHDAGTGLPNREYMIELIRQRQEQPRQRDEVLAVVHLVIDASGGLAWSAGAPTVEDVMLQIAGRLRRFTCEGVELARVRANGFAFLLSRDLQQRTAIRLAERALAAIRTLEFNHEEADPSAAGGVAFADAAVSLCQLLASPALPLAETVPA